MSNRFLLFLFLLSGNYFMQAQETFQATLSNASFTDNLEQQFKNYQLLEIDIDAIQYYLQQEEKNIEVPLSLELPSGMHWDMVLTENGLLSQDYKLYVGGGDEVSLQSEKKTIGTYSGHLSNGSGQVAVTVNQSFFYAYIRLSNESYFIEPLRGFDKTASAQDLIIYRASDVIADHEHICASDQLADKKTELNSTVAEKSADQCYILQIAIASDYDMYTKYNSSTTDVENHNIGVMNNVQLDYRSEFADNAEYVITGQFIETTNANTFTASNEANTMLNDFADWATSGTRNGFDMMGIPHDLGQLWGTKNIFTQSNGVNNFGVIGFAQTPGKYHVLEDYTTDANGLRGLTTHEIGHNFSCTHDASGTSFIMSPTNSGSTIWSSQSVSQFDARIASLASGLSACSNMGAPIADFTGSSTAGCPSSNIEYKDNSRYGRTRTWTFSGGTPSNSTSSKESVVYTTEGNYSTAITSTNGAGTNSTTKTNFLLIDQIEDSPCEPSGSSGVGGISNFTIADISNSSDAGNSATKYEDFSCSKVANLEPNTTYEFGFTNGHCNNPNDPNSPPQQLEAFRIFIDYNNDGSFASNELVFANNFIYCGSRSGSEFNITTPTTVIEDEILRMRIISDESVSGACDNPSTGQVEDYGVIFRGTSTLPIELYSFSGEQQNQSVALNWKTATEKDNNYFQLEHSFDGRNFTQITQTKGKGDANNEQTYRHIHTTPNNGINYYKLYQVDFSGKKTWLKTIAVDVQLAQMASIFPNPVSGNQLNLRLNTVDSELLQIQVINIQGQTILSHQLKVNSGQLNYNIPLNANLTAGVYHLRIMDKDSQQQQTLRLVKR